VNLLPVDGNPLWRINAQADLAATDFNHRDLDLVADEDRLILLSSEDKHNLLFEYRSQLSREFPMLAKGSDFSFRLRLSPATSGDCEKNSVVGGTPVMSLKWKAACARRCFDILTRPRPNCT
jgi:hypothetical protein